MYTLAPLHESVHLFARQGGGSPGTNRFINGLTESAWVAVFCAFILWLLGLLLAPVLNRWGAAKAEERYGGASGAANRFARSARDAFLILLATTVANEAGRGITTAVVVLTWVAALLLLFWILISTFAPGYWWLEMLLFFFITGVQIANFALAFK
ncbi:hypothetical protein SpCBS45565_g00390 [Spizellomyces sp. 'palustris']|nr:hypothetical protein SpCBS45565_g00390 [Spizellomyces sp. 'palustris']